MDLSIVIPIKDERDNLAALHSRVTAAVAPLGLDYEIVLVDDGSLDGSFPIMEAIAARDPHWKVVRLRRNYGQSAAMQAGIDWSTGDVLVTIEAMKMETSVRAERDATIAEVVARPGLQVDAKDLLVVFAPG